MESVSCKNPIIVTGRLAMLNRLRQQIDTIRELHRQDRGPDCTGGL